MDLDQVHVQDQVEVQDQVSRYTVRFHASPGAPQRVRDRFAYALAIARGEPLLYRGEDLSRRTPLPSCSEWVTEWMTERLDAEFRRSQQIRPWQPLG